MKAAIDDAGRVVIPKRLRDELGLVTGPVEVTRDGSAVRIEPMTSTGLQEVGDRLIIPSANDPLDDEAVHEMRLSDQR